MRLAGIHNATLSERPSPDAKAFVGQELRFPMGRRTSFDNDAQEFLLAKSQFVGSGLVDVEASGGIGNG
jgi:hypothetical protein